MDGIGNIPSCWHDFGLGCHPHKNHLQVGVSSVTPAPCHGSGKVCQQQDPVQALTKLHMGWNWGAFAKNHGDTFKMETSALVVLEKITIRIGHGKNKRNKPIRFDNGLPSSTSSYFRPVPVCPSFSLNNWYSFHSLEEADEHELKDKKDKKMELKLVVFQFNSRLILKKNELKNEIKMSWKWPEKQPYSESWWVSTFMQITVRMVNNVLKIIQFYFGFLQVPKASILRS